MVDFHAIEAAVLANLTEEERERSAAYLEESVIPAGTATVGGESISVAYPSVTAFIDRNPGANWMHPCRYLLINPEDMECISLESNRPPAFGPLPSQWRLIARSPGLDDWRLIRIAPKT